MIPLTLLGDLAPVDLNVIQMDGAPADSAQGITLANLETPLCPAGLSPIAKAGPCIRGNSSTLGALTARWPELVLCLANNHTMDFGASGLDATLNVCRSAKIPTFGVGPSLAEAGAPLVMQCDGLRVGLLAASDRWFGLATHDTPGVHAITPDLPNRVHQLRKDLDRIIISIHGGGEMSPWPSPRWQQTLRTLVDAGADVVHAHHPHVPLGWERWKAGHIFYGLGNTVINPAHWTQSPWTRRSWRVQIDLINLDCPPVVSEWDISSVRPDEAMLTCTRPCVDPCSPDIMDRNAPLSDPGLLEGLHQEYSVRLWEAFYANRLYLGDTASRRLRLTARTLRDSAMAWFQPSRWHQLRRDRMLFHHHLFSASGHSDEIATALGVLGGILPDRRTPCTDALAKSWLPPSIFSH